MGKLYKMMAKKKSKKNKKKHSIKSIGMRNLSVSQLEAKASDLFNRKLFGDAERSLKKILSLTPYHFESNYRLGILSLRSNDFDKALEFFNKAQEAALFDERIHYLFQSS